MYDELALGGGEGGTESGDATPDVIFELDTGDAGDAGGALEAPAAAAPPAAAPDAYTARIEAMERANAATMAELTPLVAHLAAQRRAQTEQPPFRPEQLDTDPNLKPSDLLKYLQFEMRQQAQQLIGQSEHVARATLSEQEARGQFNATELGQGNDYDSMVNRYVAPLIAQNPAVETLLAQAAPNNPAVGRMIFATIIAAIDQAGGDPVKGIKSVLAGLGAYKQGANETRRAISRAAQAAGARVLPGARTAGSGAGTKRLSSADDVWNLSERDYDRFWNQKGL